jgi:predicted Zn-dependent protease with MMP-like domain
MAYHVSKTHFSDLVGVALEEVPEQFERFLEEVRVEIVDRPSSEQLHLARVKQNGLLLGLYQGHPRTQRSVWDSGTFPDVIFIFQESIEEVCRSEQELVRQVRTTVLHEIGHHFGMTEDDLTVLGYG